MKTEKLGAAFVLHHFLSIVLFVACSHALFSQAGRGGISGLVTDTSGAIVPGATVTVRNTATADTLTTLTNGSGLYSMHNRCIARGTLDGSAAHKQTRILFALPSNSARPRSDSGPVQLRRGKGGQGTSV